MTPPDAQKLEALLSAHLRTPGTLVVLAEQLMEPSGADPAQLDDAAGQVRALAHQAASAHLPAVSALAEALADLAAALGRGQLDPLGPAGGVLGPAALALEDALALLEAGDRPDDDTLAQQAHRVARAGGREPSSPGTTAGAAPVSAPAAPAPGTYEPERWGPWDPPYADMEDDFLEEIQSAIDNLQAGLIRLSTGERDDALVNDLFRSSHSIKGQSGQMAAHPLEKVAHKLEDVLDLIRKGELAVGTSQTESLLGVIDALQSMLEQLRETRVIVHPLGREIAVMQAIMDGRDPAPAPRTPPEPAAPAPASPPEPAPAKPAPSAASPDPAPAPKKKAPAKAQYLRVDFAKIDNVMNLVGDLFVNKIRLHDGLDEVDRLQLEVHRLKNILARSRSASADAVDLEPEDARRLLQGIGKLSVDVEAIADRLHSATGETDMISADLRDQVMVMRMVPLDAILGRLGRVIFDAVQKENRGRDPGYKKARLTVEGADSEIDKVISNMLEVPLVHIVRNSVAHGIEPAAERAVAGKPEEGTVHIGAGQQGTRFVIEVTDDGRGIHHEQVRRAALARGIVTEEELGSMSEREILSLIFKPGFTTAQQADDLKGRGVGLDEVMEKISAIKGTIDVDSTVGRGTKVTLSLPLTLAINTVVLGQVAEETFAMPMAVVERVVKVSEAEVERMGDTEVFTLLDQTIPLVRVDDLLGMDRPPSRRPDDSYATVLTVGDRRFGLAMDRMTGKQDVVVKSLGTLLGEAPMVAGATLLGERCILILDPLEIAARLSRSARQAGSAAAPPSRRRSRPRMLLVEDEATTRKTLRRIFEEAGLEVFEAQDGREALDEAGRTRFSVVSTDVVMPRMDGYELTRRLRKLPAYRDVPIIMISSKGEEPDKRAGFDAGVDHYVVKPFERSQLLELMEEVMR